MPALALCGYDSGRPGLRPASLGELEPVAETAAGPGRAALPVAMTTTPLIAPTVQSVRHAVARLRETGRPVALVPTMGALHDGHLSLIRLAAADGHAVVVSVFVNPTQFNDGADLERYPRDLDGDAARAAAAGAEVVYAPQVDEVYPEGFATRIEVSGPAAGLEGAARPGHFDGVATVVAKLLLAVRPDRAVFGQKDAQQVAVIRRLVRDLHLDDIELVVGPTAREDSGLAMSSRNAHLDPDELAAATVLWRAISAAEALAAEGERDAARVRAAAEEVLRREPRCEPEYVEVVHPDTFAARARLSDPSLLCVAARVGPVRLIDNHPLPIPTLRRADVPPSTRTMLKSKIHRATVTEADLDYVGSITVDAELLAAADIRPYEQVHVVNIANGARFETYAIEGAPGAGTICLNGAAARLAQPGDRVIVLSYATFAEELLDGYEPIVVHVDGRNRRLEVADGLLASLAEGGDRSG